MTLAYPLYRTRDVDSDRELLQLALPPGAWKVLRLMSCYHP